MDTRQALLRAVADSPDDDTPRLVYADWLDENGDPARAEFIRVQIELARTVPPPGPALDPRRVKLRDCERVLIREYRNEWEMPLRARLGNTLWGVRYERGFPQEIQVSGVSALVANDFFGDPQTATELGFSGSPDTPPLWFDETTRDLVSYPGAVHLTGLSFGGLPVGDADARYVADAPHTLPNLRTLTFRSTGVTAAGVADLARSGVLPNLTEFDLHRTELGDSVVELLFGPRSRLKLKSLDLGHTLIGDAGVEALARCPGTASLEELRLGHLNLTGRAVRAITASPYLKNLQALDLVNTRLSAEDALALYQSDLPTQAKWFALSSLRFSALAGEVLRQGDGHSAGVRRYAPPGDRMGGRS